MAAAATIRSAIRSTTTSFRTSAFKHPTKPTSTSSPFRLLNQKPTPPRILRSPVELSCCMESLIPFHTATSSALLTSMISISRRACWFPEDCNDDA